MPGTFSRKQYWRWQVLRGGRYRINDDDSRESCLSSSSGQSTEQHSPPSPTASDSCDWMMAGDLPQSAYRIFHGLESKSKLRKKSTAFSYKIHVVLIPTIDDYVEAQLAQDLWWTEEDYTSFKQDALEELQIFMKARKIANPREALKIIYQEADPSPD